MKQTCELNIILYFQKIISQTTQYTNKTHAKYGDKLKKQDKAQVFCHWMPF